MGFLWFGEDTIAPEQRKKVDRLSSGLIGRKISGNPQKLLEQAIVTWNVRRSLQAEFGDRNLKVKSKHVREVILRLDQKLVLIYTTHQEVLNKVLDLLSAELEEARTKILYEGDKGQASAMAKLRTTQIKCLKILDMVQKLDYLPATSYLAQYPIGGNIAPTVTRTRLRAKMLLENIISLAQYGRSRLSWDRTHRPFPAERRN